MTNRIETYDILRALMVIWIVCIWHKLDYQSSHNGWIEYNSICFDVTKIVLASFTLLSGIFLNKYSISSYSDVLTFYKNRLLRFYPLLIIAIFLFYYTTRPGGDVWFDKKTLFYSIIGISCLKSCAPSTLWYMEMLLLFYAVIPLLLYRPKVTVISTCILILLFNSNGVDPRIMLYFPFYVIGLNLKPQQIINTISNHKHLFFYFSSIICAFLLLEYLNKPKYFEGITILLGLISLFILVIYLERFTKCIRGGDYVKTVLSWISYTALTSYLFHRPLYWFLLIIKVPLWICPFIIIPIAYIIQYLYDSLISALRIENKNFFTIKR